MIAPLVLAVSLAHAPLPTEKIDAAVAAQMAEQKLVGVSIGVIRGGKIVYLKGYGFADKATKTPCDTKTVINWASNSKPLAGVLAMQLVDAKKLDLDADVRKYVPEWPDKGRVITTRQLLCHQSGIPHYANGKIVPADTVRPGLDPVHAVDRFAKSPLIFDPGTKTAYSSHAFVLLSAVIQRAGGEPYDDQLRQRIVEPLKMNSLVPDGPSKGKANWATGYTVLGPAPEEEHAWKFGAGGSKSNVEDFAKWAAGLLDGKLVSERSRTAMWTKQTLADGRETNYGLGFVVETRGGTLTVSHNGGQPETATRMVLDVAAKNGIVVMTNCSFGSIGNLEKAISKAIGE
jgi:CubicO group peptidase (beta-lactamase class C family)